MTGNMLKPLATLATALLLGAAFGAAGEPARASQPVDAPVYANDTVVLDRDSVMLSDLFNGLDASKDVRVADAPQPGETLYIRLDMLQQLAAQYHLAWTPRHGRVRVAVEREGRAVPLQLVRQAITEQINKNYVSDQIEVELTNRRLSLMVPSDIVPDVSVETLDYNSREQRFAAIVAIPVGGDKTLRAKVQGEVYSVIDVPVLNHHFTPGETIHADDVSWTTMRARRSNANTVTDLDQLVGMSARRPITAGQVIRRTDVQPIRIVTKGDYVTLVFQTSFMTLTIRGEALENGARRDTIRVKNLASGKTVIGTVTDSGIISVAGPRLALN